MTIPRTETGTKSQLAVMTLTLLLIVASRLLRLDVTATEIRVDEIWSIWQTFGSPQQIVDWTPFDWTPLYYLLLAGWKELVGIHPIVIRFLSVLLFILGASWLYRALTDIWSAKAALIAVLTYSALGYNIFLSTELRGYALLLGLLPLTFWFTVRYFDRPGLWRGVLLGLGLAALFYTSLTSVGAFAVLGLYTLLVYGRRVWRWLLPGVIAVAVSLPEILDKSKIAVNRLDATNELPLSPFVEAVLGMYRNYAGDSFPLWVLIFAIAFVWLLRAGLLRDRRVMALLIWALLPFLLYLFNPVLGFFQARYSWWVMPGIALWLGIGCSHLPGLARRWIALSFAVLLFIEIPLNRYQIPDAPFGTMFVWLRDRAQWGDVLLIDPQCDCVGMEQIDYLSQVYFPQGLPVVTDPTGHRRVWYLRSSHDDRAVREAVKRNRVAREFFGPADALLRLYEAPPNIEGIAFANGMRFHGIEIVDDTGPLVLREGESVRLRLWWSADRPIDLDYSVSVFIHRAGDYTAVIDQDDSAPRLITDDAPTETSHWQVGEYYVDERELVMKFPSRDGDYGIALVVYQWWDGMRIDAPGALNLSEDKVLPLHPLTVQAW